MNQAPRIKRRAVRSRWEIPIGDRICTVTFARRRATIHVPHEPRDVVINGKHRACEAVAVRLVRQAIEALERWKLDQEIQELERVQDHAYA